MEEKKLEKASMHLPSIYLRELQLRKEKENFVERKVMHYGRGANKVVSHGVTGVLNTNATLS